jgi:glutamine synthetase
MAEAISEAADYIEKADDVELAVHDYIKLLATKHQRIIFNGNGYSEEWAEEAERRGLPNITSMFDAIPALTKENNVKTFEKFKVFTKSELESRADIEYEQYAKKINIEARTMVDMVEKQFIPAAIAYEKKVAETINAVKATGAGLSCETQIEILKKIDRHIVEMSDARKELADTLVGLSFENNHDSAEHFYKKVVPAMEALRKPVDELEMLVSKEDWPMPSYGDLLFSV